MVFRIHRAERHGSTVPGIELMTLVSNHHFPRHSHDQFGIGVVAFGAQRFYFCEFHGKEFFNSHRRSQQLLQGTLPSHLR